jgi:hypothetical protein
MKIKTHKKNQICILNNEFVVVVDRYFDKENQIHKYYIKKLKLYHYHKQQWHSYSYKQFLYSQLIPTSFVIKDIAFKDRKPNLTPLYLEYPELSL